MNKFWEDGVEPMIWPPREPETVVIPGREWSELPPERLEVLKPTRYKRELKRIVEELTSGPSKPPRGPGGVYPFSDGFPEEIERCAFYRTFRAGGDWGVYIGLNCWFNIARCLYFSGLTAEVAAREAFRLLYRHEYFHFDVDRVVTYLERVVFRATGYGHHFWTTYHMKNNPSRLEEALANAYAYEHAGKGLKKSEEAKVKKVIGALMSGQAVGYRDYKEALGKNKTPARDALLSEYVGVQSSARTSMKGLSKLFSASLDFKKHDPPSVDFEGDALRVFLF